MCWVYKISQYSQLQNRWILRKKISINLNKFFWHLDIRSLPILCHLFFRPWNMHLLDTDDGLTCVGPESCMSFRAVWWTLLSSCLQKYTLCICNCWVSVSTTGHFEIYANACTHSSRITLFCVWVLFHCLIDRVLVSYFWQIIFILSLQILRVSYSNTSNFCRINFKFNNITVLYFYTDMSLCIC